MAKNCRTLSRPNGYQVNLNKAFEKLKSKLKPILRFISVKAYNNGPLPILSQPITFSIQISPPIYPPFFYKIYFRDAEQQFDMIEVDTQGSFEKNVFLRPLKKAKPGQIRMEISAELWMGYYPITLSASTSTTFNITRVNRISR